MSARSRWRSNGHFGKTYEDLQQKKIDIYRGRDPRHVPTYSFTEASRWLQIPLQTLRSWVHGRHYPTNAGKKRFEPIIFLPDPNLPLLSFTNLIEAHVLDAIRYKHKVPLKNIRDAVNYLRERSNSQHPLAEYWFQLKGVDLLIEEGDLIVNATKKGQLEMKDIIHAYLKRVVRDPKGAAFPKGYRGEKRYRRSRASKGKQA